MLGGVSLGACTTRRNEGGELTAGPLDSHPHTDRPTTSVDASSSTTPATTAPPMFPAYQPLDGEVHADAKTVAARVAEELATYGPASDPTTAIAAQRGVYGFDPAGFASAAEPLLVAGAWSRARVVYPQLGGLAPHHDPRQCSVMVVLEQHLWTADSGSKVVSRCLDVRLRLEGGMWRLQGLADSSGGSVARPADLSPAVVRVLDHPSLSLPDNVRWDIQEGLVADRLLHTLADLADQVPIAATTCRRGHPVNVFGTSSRSAHMAGRAIDLWSVGGPVVQQRLDQRSVAHQIGNDLHRSGLVANFGSPWSFGRASFTDPVHHDHFHLGF